MSEGAGGAGRVAVVTGAAGGIGAAAVEVLLERGWTVYGWDLKAGSEQRVQWRSVDISDHASVEKAARELTAVSFVLNAAGVGEFGPVKSISPEQWNRVIGINLSGTFYVGRFLHPALKAGKASVVNIASAGGLRSGVNRAAYGTSKAGVIMLTQVQALEWAKDDIRVFAIAPGFVRTPMTQEAIDTGRIDYAASLERIPQGRYIEPRELAEAILALAGDTFKALTGQTIVLDGGWMTNGFPK